MTSSFLGVKYVWNFIWKKVLSVCMSYYQIYVNESFVVLKSWINFPYFVSTKKQVFKSKKEKEERWKLRLKNYLISNFQAYVMVHI